MFKNSYWLLTSKKTKTMSQLILELTPDGMAYLWPVLPGVSKPTLPIEADQDPEALAADGDFLEKAGLYRSITDFMNHSRYSAETFDYSVLGDYESIRSCRAAFESCK